MEDSIEWYSMVCYSMLHDLQQGGFGSEFKVLVSAQSTSNLVEGQSDSGFELQGHCGRG